MSNLFPKKPDISEAEAAAKARYVYKEDPWIKLISAYRRYQENLPRRFRVWELTKEYTRPKKFTTLVTLYVIAFYTGIIGAAVDEQIYKEKYWDEHPGHVVPLKGPRFYWGAWKVERGKVPAHLKPPSAK